jgi:hypothetical protein
MRAQSCRAVALAALAAATAARAADFYVDPVAGADRGDGSSARPWRSLQAVIDQQVETRNWASLPWTGQALVASHPGAPVKAGDTIWLRSGDHGALEIVGAYNAAPVTVAAEPGATPRLTGLRIRSAARWVVRGLSVSPWYGTPPAFRAIATVEDHDWTGPVSDVVLDGLEIFTVPDEAAWATAADWDAGSWDGVLADGDRAVVRNCRVRNVNYGIAVTGVGSRVEHNLVDGFCGDGLRGLGDDEVFEYNLVKNAREVNADHRDGFQSWSYGAGGVGTGVVRNVTLRGNVIVAWESPAVRFAGTLQGIGCFDGTYDGWVVENNVVITDHWHGISFYGATNLRIVNNTVLDLNAVDPGPPWIMVTAHKDGTPSRDAVVRNNLATDLSADGTHVVADGNLILPADATAWFVDLPRHDLRLATGSPAIDHGLSAQAPAIDADGVARPAGAAVDVGAFEYAPGATRPPGGGAGPVGGTPTPPAQAGASPVRASCGGCGGSAGDGLLLLAIAAGAAVLRGQSARAPQRAYPTRGTRVRVPMPPRSNRLL